MKSLEKKVEIVVYEQQEEAAERGESCLFDSLCEMLAAKKIVVRRYSLQKDREQFKKNEDLWTMICCAGMETLPATYVNGEIEKIEGYPTKEEIDSWLLAAK